MTALAYRNGVMAADTQLVADNTVQGHMIKCKKVNGWLVGGAGNAASLAMFLDWCEKGMLDHNKPKPENIGAILVNPKGEVFHLDDEMFMYQVHDDFHCQGSATDILRGAMAFGASAEEAVAVAIQEDASCGGKITVIKLDG